MYTCFRFVSIAGELPQTALPVYPGGAIIVFQRIAPDARSRASMLPRNDNT